MYCKKCGRQLEEGLEICPYCGADIKTGKVYGEKEKAPKEKKPVKYKYNSNEKGTGLYSIMGFIFSLTGVSIFPLIGSIIGMVLSCLGLKETSKNGADYYKLAVAGLIISLISLILYCAFIVFVVLMIVGILPKIPGFNF